MAACWQSPRRPVATAGEPSLTDFAEAVRRWRTNAGGVDELDAKTIRRGDAEATLAATDPARIIEGEYWTGHQEQLYTTKRHPCWTRYRTALTPDGRIAALTVDYLLDGGAYTTISPVVLARGILHAALAYRCEHVLERALEKSDFTARFAQCSRGAPDQPLWRGVGLAFFGHGSDFTGDGEARILSPPGESVQSSVNSDQ